MNINSVSTDKAPAAIGPYSQALIAGSFIYTSGQIPINPVTGEIVKGDIVAQTNQVMQNLKVILEAAGSNLGSVVKTTVFIKDMNDFQIVNLIYNDYFQQPFPARSCVEVARLPKDVGIEIEVVALIDEK